MIARQMGFSLTFGICVVLNFAGTHALEQSSCDLAGVTKCSADLESMIFTDPCGYFASLEICLLPFSAACAAEPSFQAKISEMQSMKVIFCPEFSGCDLFEVEKCMKMLDFSKLNTTDLSTWGTFCGDQNSVYQNFETCYNKAVVPCYEDPIFLTSGVQDVANTVSIGCLSTDDCPYFQMTQCTAAVENFLIGLSPIPNSKTYNGICTRSESFMECLGPMVRRCGRLVGGKPKLDVFYQMKNFLHFVEINCNYYREDLEKHSTTCLDKEEVLADFGKCEPNLADVTPGNQKVCGELGGYVTCLHDVVAGKCSDSAAVATGRFSEAYALNVTMETYLVNCSSIMKFSNMTTAAPVGTTTVSAPLPTTPLSTLTTPPFSGPILPTITTTTKAPTTTKMTTTSKIPTTTTRPPTTAIKPTTPKMTTKMTSTPKPTTTPMVDTTQKAKTTPHAKTTPKATTTPEVTTPPINNQQTQSPGNQDSSKGSNTVYSAAPRITVNSRLASVPLLTCLLLVLGQSLLYL